jgi:hypothetical protein
MYLSLETESATSRYISLLALKTGQPSNSSPLRYTYCYSKSLTISFIISQERFSRFSTEEEMPGVLIDRPPTAPLVAGPTTKLATKPTNPLPQYLTDEARPADHEEFSPGKHLNFQPPGRIISMKEIGLEGHGISPNAVSEPFPLFTEEAIKQIRAEIFSDEVLRSCQYASTFNKNMVRGMGSA